MARAWHARRGSTRCWSKKMDRRVRKRSASVGTVHRGSQGRHGASEANCCFFFLPTKEGEGRRKQPERVRRGGGRGEEIVIQRACDDCQAVLLHCRCDADITLLPHSSPPCLPPPRLVCCCPLPPALSPTLSFCGHFPITLSTPSFFSL